MAHIVDGQSFGPYTIISRLGRGGMASVYRAYEARLDRTVALKVLPDDLLNQPGFLERFEREARVIARLEHPHIVPVYASGIDEGQPWMALRLVRGGNLADWLEQGRFDQDGLDRDTGLRYLTCIADALDFAHAQNIVHRDLKPQNILLGERDECYIADFGIASLLSAATRLTQTGALLGTPQYMAPEQITGKALGPPTDLYALGVIAYRWLSGELPFDADTPYAVMYKHVSAPLPLEPLRNQPARVQEVLARMLAKQPEDRWASAGAFVRALTAALIESAQPATLEMRRPNTPPSSSPPPPPSTPPPAAAPPRTPANKPAPDTATRPRRAIGGWLAALAAVLVIALGSWAAYRWMPLNPASPSALSHGGFEDLGDGGVRDTKTGLVWARADNGRDINWNDAMSYCASKGSGWSLPTVAQAQSMYDASGKYQQPRSASYESKQYNWTIKPATDLIQFSAGAGGLWTSEGDGSSSAFSVTLHFGGRTSHSVSFSTNYRALCVRPRIEQTEQKAVAAAKADAEAKAEAERLAAERKAQAEAERKTQLARHGGFEDLGDGSVRDTKTGLVWAKSDNGGDIDWNGATNYCANKSGGWSLPTVAQAQSMYDESGRFSQARSAYGFNWTIKPATDLVQFSQGAGWLWTSERDGSSSAFGVALTSGGRDSNAVSSSVNSRALCVRRRS